MIKNILMFSALAFALTEPASALEIRRCTFELSGNDSRIPAKGIKLKTSTLKSDVRNFETVGDFDVMVLFAESQNPGVDNLLWVGFADHAKHYQPWVIGRGTYKPGSKFISAGVWRWNKAGDKYVDLEVTCTLSRLMN